MAQYKPPVLEQASGNAGRPTRLAMELHRPIRRADRGQFELLADLEYRAIGRAHRIRWV